MTAMAMNVAIRSALDVMLGRDENVVVFGEDVGYFGGVFRCTEGLQAKHGATRVFDTPIAEGGIIGAAVGMGAYGLRPVPEIQFADYVYPGLDQLISEAARLRYRSGAEFTAPITVRMPSGGGIHGGQTHSQSPEALFTHVCGLKTVIPSTPYDAKGLLISAIEDDDPVIHRAQAPLQRSVRRPSGPPDRAVVGARARRRARRSLPRAARDGERSS
jgi:2-oxoisovalerate dehydrogenase E1 component beta subunit